MGTDVSRLTVFFECPFWVGLYEREEAGRYEVCKITFGAEPKDYEVYDFLLKHWGMLRFSPPAKADEACEKRVSAKRMQRLIGRQIAGAGVGTKAQQALKSQREQEKTERACQSRRQREAEKERRFEMHQEKRKEKHKGH